MNRVGTLLSSFVFLAFAGSAYAATSKAQCAKEYDKCKRKVENMFNKKPCQKARAACESNVAKAVQQNTKSRMLNGHRDGISIEEERRLTSKEAALRRLRERQRAQAKSPTKTGGSMRDSVKSN